MNNYEKKLLNGGDYATAQLSKAEFTKLLEVYDWQEIFEGYLSEFYIDNEEQLFTKYNFDLQINDTLDDIYMTKNNQHFSIMHQGSNYYEEFYDFYDLPYYIGKKIIEMNIDINRLYTNASTSNHSYFLEKDGHYYILSDELFFNKHEYSIAIITLEINENGKEYFEEDTLLANFLSNSNIPYKKELTRKERMNHLLLQCFSKENGYKDYFDFPKSSSIITYYTHKCGIAPFSPYSFTPCYKNKIIDTARICIEIEKAEHFLDYLCLFVKNYDQYNTQFINLHDWKIALETWNRISSTETVNETNTILKTFKNKYKHVKYDYSAFNPPYWWLQRTQHLDLLEDLITWTNFYEQYCDCIIINGI